VGARCQNRGWSLRPRTANRLEAHEATVGSGGEAHGDHAAWAQPHPHMLHSCEDKHAQRILENKGMPGVKAHQLGGDT